MALAACCANAPTALCCHPCAHAGGADVDATNAKGENALHKLVQSWKDSRMLVRGAVPLAPVKASAACAPSCFLLFYLQHRSPCAGWSRVVLRGCHMTSCLLVHPLRVQPNGKMDGNTERSVGGVLSTWTRAIQGWWQRQDAASFATCSRCAPLYQTLMLQNEPLMRRCSAAGTVRQLRRCWMAARTPGRSTTRVCGMGVAGLRALIFQLVACLHGVRLIFHALL